MASTAIRGNTARRPEFGVASAFVAWLAAIDTRLAALAARFIDRYFAALDRVGDGLAEVGLTPAGHAHAGDVSVAHNMIGTAIQFGLALMIAIVMMIVTGLFVAKTPTSGAFSGAINTTVDVGGAGFVIVGVTLLAVPVVGLVAYFYNSGLGGLISGGGRGR